MFGWENIGKGSVTEARAAVKESMAALEPMLHDLENRAGGILHGLLDRLNGTEITITVSIPPVPKAKPNI